MFDERAYQLIAQAAEQILNNNINKVGREFVNGFIYDYNPRNGRQQQANAEDFLSRVTETVIRQNNGSSQFRDENQLFEIVGLYIDMVFKVYADRQNQQRGGSTFGFGQTQQRTSTFGSSGGGFGGGLMGGGNAFGRQQQQSPLIAGSHLADDSVRTTSAFGAPSGGAFATPTPTASPQASPSVSPLMKAEDTMTYVDNPFDDFPKAGLGFSAVEGKAVWGSEEAKDRRIVIAKHIDFKTQDPRFAINVSQAFHQVVLNDPLDVVKDFFTIAPDSLLGTSFMHRIYYTHLDIIDVPTQDFADVRQKCIEAVAKDRQVLLHRTLASVIDTMKVGPYKALEAYLLKHVNRALHLAARKTDKPSTWVRLSKFEQIGEMLSSEFKHSFVSHPEGRAQLERIVGSALWNALVMNSDAMFSHDTDIPTHAIQSSSAFPYSVEDVYPNKYAIPHTGDEVAEKFLANLHEYELSKRSYILSRRSVVVTNILGRNILQNLGKDPALFQDPIAVQLNQVKLAFADYQLDPRDEIMDVLPYAKETPPLEQLEDYYNDPQGEALAEVEEFGRIPAPGLPVDQTIYSVQYGVDPKKYLAAIDLHTTLDQTPDGTTVLSLRDVPVITPNR